MKSQDPNLTVEHILQHWHQGRSSLDWRRMAIKGKIEWLKACLHWTGLPQHPIPAFDYIIDGNQVQSDHDYFCLIGEVFFGYRGYFGTNLDGWVDCLSEIYMHDKTKAPVETGAKVIIKNSQRMKEALTEEFFLEIVKGFEKYGFGVDVE